MDFFPLPCICLVLLIFLPEVGEAQVRVHKSLSGICHCHVFQEADNLFSLFPALVLTLYTFFDSKLILTLVQSLPFVSM